MGMRNDEVVRRWRHHNEENHIRSHAGGNSNSVTFIGATLYSYRTPIARYHDGYVLVSSRKFGVTMARHVRMAERGVMRYVTFRVPNVEFPSDENTIELHHNLTQAAKDAVRLFKHRSDNGSLPNYLADRIIEAHRLASDYEQLVLKSESAVERLDAIMEQVVFLRCKKWDVYMQPKAVERRERQQARRLAREALGV